MGFTRRHNAVLGYGHCVVVRPSGFLSWHVYRAVLGAAVDAILERNEAAYTESRASGRMIFPQFDERGLEKQTQPPSPKGTTGVVSLEPAGEHAKHSRTGKVP